MKTQTIVEDALNYYAECKELEGLNTVLLQGVERIVRAIMTQDLAKHLAAQTETMEMLRLEVGTVNKILLDYILADEKMVAEAISYSRRKILEATKMNAVPFRMEEIKNLDKDIEIDLD